MIWIEPVELDLILYELSLVADGVILPTQRIVLNTIDSEDS